MFVQDCVRNFGLVVVLMSVSVASNASVTLSGTRAVYPGDAREITVDMTNQNDTPALMQAWLDSGDPAVAPGVEELPFIITPPLTRIEPKEGQTLRIAFTGEPLPKDKESVYWLNVLEIPAKKKDVEGKNVMRMAFRSRIKLFYRPVGLHGTIYDAAKAITWSMVKDADRYVLRATNDSPYHASISGVKLESAGKEYNNKNGGMISPMASKDYPLTDSPGPLKSGTITFRWLNDFGIAQTQVTKLK